MVYKARDRQLDRVVALKVLPPAKVADADRKRRFVQEAQAASALNHPNIVTIHDIDEVDGDGLHGDGADGGAPLDRLIPRQGCRSDGAPLRRADRRCPGGRPCRGHCASRPEAGQHHGHHDGLVKVLDFGLAKLPRLGACRDGQPRDDANAQRPRRTKA